jgi:hypothetical protein
MNKYQRPIYGALAGGILNQAKTIMMVDVYDVLKAFNVTCPATAHAIKKLLAAGERGHKDKETDLNEAISSIRRAIELQQITT